MTTPARAAICCLALISALLTSVTFAAQASGEPDPMVGGALGHPSFDCAGGRCDAIVRGLRAFFDRRLTGLAGNGRACADCHLADDAFQLSPASAERRFQQLQADRQQNAAADDPLFRAIDADDFRVNGATASDYSTLRQHGLVRVTFPLPPALKLIDPATNMPSSEGFVDVWRMVPTVNDVAVTGPDSANGWPRDPNPFGGYQLDARLGTLQEQALGALMNHAEIQGFAPPRLLDDLAAFQLALFSNDRVRALAEAIAAGAQPLPDVDPPLNALQQQGKATFDRACAQCHGGPTQTTAQRPIARFHDISTQCPRPVDTAVPPRFVFAPCAPLLAAHARTYLITLVNGTTARRTSSDPGRALLTGFVGGAPPTDDWNKLDVTGLRGISRTAPYFHNNSAATLEDVVDHYVEFFKRVRANAAPGVVPAVATTDGVNFDRQPRPEEREGLLAYLRAL